MSYRPPYPYARILGGFILGNIILTALLYLLLRPGFLAGSMMPFDPHTLAALCGAAVIAAVLTVLPLFLGRAEREQQGVGRTMMLIGLFSLPQTFFPYQQALYAHFAPPFLGEILIVLAIKMMAFAQLAYSLLPRPEPTFEDRRDWRAHRYPYWRIVFLYPAIGAVLCHLLLLVAGDASRFSEYLFLDRCAQLAVPYLASALWFAAWRLRRTMYGISQATAVATLVAYSHFMLYRRYEETAAPLPLTLRFAAIALVLAFLLLPQDPEDQPGPADYGKMLIAGILAIALCALACANLFPK
ncbi:hypothetical protein [Cardiobacterium valvarum]|uniref:Uncharacterized protein n=1 Tax=Cardiobacterium valvarum TaxID=194702 RepID=A0A381EEW7_9GAMM|nr:hypothetical protein [Cardiobacterium valvarum]SUX25317.1 Uncharacterised protein [Cardiobacterium valvarum]